MKTMYHATSEENYRKILNEKLIRMGIDGIIYLCDESRDAAKFPAIRGVDPVYVMEVQVPIPELIEEQFDHNPKFFGCKAYGYPENIPTQFVTDVIVYTAKPTHEIDMNPKT